MSHCTVCEEPLPASTRERGFRTHFGCRPAPAAVVAGRVGDNVSCGCGKRFTKRFDGGRETCLDCWRAKKRDLVPLSQRRGAVAECACGIKFAKRFDGANETCLACFKRKRAAEMVDALVAPDQGLDQATERYDCMCRQCGVFPCASRNVTSCLECLLAGSL